MHPRAVDADRIGRGEAEADSEAGLNRWGQRADALGGIIRGARSGDGGAGTEISVFKLKRDGTAGAGLIAESGDGVGVSAAGEIIRR